MPFTSSTAGSERRISIDSVGVISRTSHGHRSTPRALGPALDRGEDAAGDEDVAAGADHQRPVDARP